MTQQLKKTHLLHIYQACISYIEQTIQAKTGTRLTIPNHTRGKVKKLIVCATKEIANTLNIDDPKTLQEIMLEYVKFTDRNEGLTTYYKFFLLTTPSNIMTFIDQKKRELEEQQEHQNMLIDTISRLEQWT